MQLFVHNGSLTGVGLPSRDLRIAIESRAAQLQTVIQGVSQASSGQFEERQIWELRSYPVIAVLAPVLSTHENKIEFPGDPMCLYAALSVAVESVEKSRIIGV